MRVLLNSNAGSADGADLDALRAVAREVGAEILEVDSPEDTRTAVAEAARDGVDVVVAAGGDGTVCLVTDALMAVGDSAETRPALGILPLGTGNDFARTLCLPIGDPEAALRVLAEATERTVDVIRVTFDGQTRHALNVCNGGFTGALDDKMDDDLKASWGPFAYVVGTVRALPEMTAFRVHVGWDGGPEEVIEAFNVVVANGRTAGGGTPVAPAANPEDGLLDVVIVRAGGALDVARLGLGALTGDVLADENVVFNRVRTVTVRAEPPMPFNVDGELCTEAPVAFEVAPGALRVRVGPEYIAAPDAPT